MNNYIVYHLHSDLSNGVTNVDSITKFQQYVDRAKECGMTALGFSEHGSVFSWLSKKMAIEAAGMKYIHAEEFYVCDDLYKYTYPEDLPNEVFDEIKDESDLDNDNLDGICESMLGDEDEIRDFQLVHSKTETPKKEVRKKRVLNREKLKKYREDHKRRVRENMHFILIAKNWEGVKELNRLSSKSFNRGDGHFYFLPRIQVEDILNTSENIICTSACLASPLNKGDKEVKRSILEFFAAHKDRCFLEIQHHNVEEQKQYNLQLLKWHEEYGIPLIAGTDTHSLNEPYAEARTLLQKSKHVFFGDEQGWDLTWKTYAELVEAYRTQNALPMDIVLEAIANTLKMAEMVQPFEVDRSYKYPHLWEEPEKVLRQKIDEGIKRRGIKKYPNYQEYLDRIEYEISVYKHNGAVDFILLMEDVLGYCNSNGIQIGYGRGSATGSIVCWLLGITEMDSIKFGLSFERFQNVERVSLSDVDSDIPPNRRDELINWLFHHKGLYVSDIITFNTIALKGAVRDVCRGLYENDPNRNYLAITDEISKAIDDHEDEMRKKYPEIFKYVDLINGTVVSIGTHPCGRLVVDHPFDGDIGLCTTSTDPHPISQLWMHECDFLNYVKLDLLALDTIELIADTCKTANIPMLLPDNIDVDDDKVWNSMRNDTTGIFQWESNTGQDYIKRLLSDSTIAKFKKYNPNLSKMELITIGNSAIRPAGESYRDDLANGIVRKYDSDVISNFLKPTMGYLVYQCQIIDFLHLYCGFTMGQADVVRRGFAKKSGTEQFIPVIKDGGYMPSDKDHEKHIDGFIKTVGEKYGISKEEAEKEIVGFLEVIKSASRYLFSRNHSEPYSYEGYACAWLRYYYPLEFLTTDLNINADKKEKTRAFTKYAHKIGIKILPPKFRYSSSKYNFDKGTNVIYKGLASINSMGAETGDNLLRFKDFYGDFVDLLIAIKEQKLAKKNEIEILIKIGFFAEFGSCNKLLYTKNLFEQFYGKKNLKKSKAEELGLKPETVLQFAAKETKTQYTNVDMIQLIRNLADNSNIPEETVGQRALWQIELLGYTGITDSSLDGRYNIVTEVNDKPYKPIIQLYCLNNGKSYPMRCKRSKWKDKAVKTTWKDLPLEKLDLIYLKGFKKEPKPIKVGDEWKDGNEMEWILTDYSLVKRTEDKK